jgi:hypothetical protein
MLRISEGITEYNGIAVGIHNTLKEICLFCGKIEVKPSLISLGSSLIVSKIF